MNPIFNITNYTTMVAQGAEFSCSIKDVPPECARMAVIAINSIYSQYNDVFYKSVLVFVFCGVLLIDKPFFIKLLKNPLWWIGINFIFMCAATILVVWSYFVLVYRG